MHCKFCNYWIADVATAISEGWSPSYWDCETEAEIDGPVCSACCAERLRVSGYDGDLELPTNAIIRMSIAQY